MVAYFADFKMLMINNIYAMITLLSEKAIHKKIECLLFSFGKSDIY